MLIGSYEIVWEGEFIQAPRAYWADLASGAVITRGLEQCLFVYPRDQWSRVEGIFEAWPLTRADARALARFFLAGAHSSPLDERGRLSIPQALRAYASLNSSTLMVGLLTHAELWNAERWRQVNAATEVNAAAAAERLTLGSNREVVK